MFPKIKKRLGSFLVGEDGKISKQALVALGAFLGSGVLAGILLSKEGSAQIQHTNDLTASYDGGGTASATHSHHSNDISPPPPDGGDSGACADGACADAGCGCADAAC